MSRQEKMTPRQEGNFQTGPNFEWLMQSKKSATWKKHQTGFDITTVEIM